MHLIFTTANCELAGLPVHKDIPICNADVLVATSSLDLYLFQMTKTAFLAFITQNVMFGRFVAKPGTFNLF